MHAQLKKNVRLPSGSLVTISDEPEKWWQIDGRSGYVHPSYLAPDPDQPRKHMHSGKLDELEMSIAERGVRQAITVTPRSRAPWVHLADEHRHAFFIVVSGHRRLASARKVGLLAVPIQVVIYADENEHRTDAGILNACRDDLTELEEGFEFVRLREAGATLESIRKAWGYKAQMQVYNRMNLTKLHPEIQKLIMPDSDGKRQFSITVAGILGGVKAPTADELDDLAMNVMAIVDAMEVAGYESFENLSEDERRFAMQKIMVAVIRKRHLNAVRAGEFIRDHSLRFGTEVDHGTYGKRSRRYEPAKRKEVLSNLVKEVAGSVVIDWKPDELRRIFELSTREEVDEYITKLKAADDVLTGIMRVLSGIRDAKRPTPPEVLKLTGKRTGKILV